MLASTRFSPSKAQLNPPSAVPDPNPCDPPVSQPQKLKRSAKLNRWSMARSIHSHRKLDRPAEKSGRASAEVVNPPAKHDDGVSERISDEDNGGKSIYIVSDGTGWTAENSVSVALAQFEHCLAEHVCSVNTHMFSGIDDMERLIEIVKQAAKEDGMLVYTLADPSMAESARKACKLWDVLSTDVLGPITKAIASHLGVSPSGIPRWGAGRNSPLNEDYFQRIEAIEFTIKQDDGAQPQNLKKADIVLTGVSRTGKTPLSIYLAQKGYKVANVPIVMGVELPKTLFEISSHKVFGLTINPVVLQAIRRTRAKTLGLAESDECHYSEMDYVKQDLEYARKIFAQNPSWPVIEVTSKAVEETAAIILGLYQDRKQKCWIPRISKRY